MLNLTVAQCACSRFFRQASALALTGLIVLFAPSFASSGIAIGMEYKTEFISPFKLGVIKTKDIKVSNDAMQIEPLVSNQGISGSDRPHSFAGGFWHRYSFTNRLAAGMDRILASENASYGGRGRIIKFEITNQILGDEHRSIQPDFIGRRLTGVIYPNDDAGRGVTSAYGPMVNIKIGSQLSFGDFVGQPNSISSGIAGFFDGAVSLPHFGQLTLEGLRSACCRFPCVISENNKEQSEKRNQKMREIVRISDRSPHATKDRAHPFPAFIFFGAAICAALGFGLLAGGTHVWGILFLLLAIIGGWLPYYLRSTNCSSENVGVLPVIVAELELGDIERQKVRERQIKPR